mgnify:CR=1 FL=1
MEAENTKKEIKKEQEKPYWEGKHFSFYSHKECEFFPCHETKDTENFNCLFCYCPLYALGSKCGGNYKYTLYSASQEEKFWLYYE